MSSYITFNTPLGTILLPEYYFCSITTKMKHLDLAYEKFSDLLDELQWGQYRYTLALETLNKTSFTRFLKKSLEKHREHSIHLSSMMRKANKNYEPFAISDSHVDQEWARIKSEGLDELSVLKYCLQQDKVILKLMTSLIDDGWLPTGLLSSLVSAEFQLKQTREELKKLRKKLKEQPKNGTTKPKSFLKGLKLRLW